ncbi:MAG: hypothetical protein ACKVPJ_13880 [Chitinophagales bacterium]
MKFFSKQGWLYVPANAGGWIFMLLAFATDIWLFVAIDCNSHSVSDTLINFLPYFTSVWVFFSWFAKNTSGDKQKLQY